MKVSFEYAETHFADLLAAIDSGEEVEITRPDMPSLRLVVSSLAEPSKPKAPRILGALRGKIIVPSEEEWHAGDKELERLMNGSADIYLRDQK